MKISTMKKCNTANHQEGFFDLGISLVVLALSGAFAYAATPDQDARVIAQQPQTEIVASLESGNENSGIYQ